MEKKKALRVAKEAMRAGPPPKSEEKRKPDGKKEERRTTKPQNVREPREPQPQGKDGWDTTGSALRGVPQSEIDQHKKVQGGCWRCGRTGHRTYDCFSFQTLKGTELPPAPWKVAAVPDPEPATGKRKREDDERNSTAKQQKVAAVEEMVTDLPAWADADDSDF